MKKNLSLILAALLLASSMTACGKTTPNETEGGTTAVETNVSETEPVATNAPATDSPETEAPASSYATDKITENGVAAAHIVLFDGADQLEKYASEELAYHIKKVSGADVTVTNAVQKVSLPIIICTPDSLPELETLFPEDLAWLRDTGIEGSTERWGDDGFAIRQSDNKLYIFGATPRGALNGVYDFIEDNMGVIWTRADESIGLVYDEMPTIEIAKADYREKSPFDLRSWTLAGNSMETQVMFSRNKLNAYALTPGEFVSLAQNGGYPYDDIGMEPFITNHNIKWWIKNSPLYDPNERDYWDTDAAGNHVTAENSKQVNYWSEKVVDVIAASVIAFLDTYKESAGLTYVGVCIEDNGSGRVIPEDSQPFEYAPGQFVDPGAQNFESTVFYTCLNKIARKVAEVHPDITLHTYTYNFAEICPECEIEDNVFLTVAPIEEDLSSSLFDPDNIRNAKIYNNIEDWKEKSTDLFFYNYYGCHYGVAVYERPIWDLIKEQLVYYRDSGFRGLVPEGIGDVDVVSNWYSYLTDGAFIRQNPDATHTYADGWSMNALTFWIYSKLAWNPDEDIDTLIQTFCDKCYGDASPHMQEYYRLLKAGWDEGIPDFKQEFMGYICYKTDPIYFVDFFLFNPYFEENAGLPERMLDTLTKAMDAANDTEKERIRYIKENMELLIENFG